MQYAGLMYNCYSTFVETANFFKTLKQSQEEEITSKHYARLSLRGVVVTSKIATCVLNFFKLQQLRLETNEVVKVKLNNIRFYIVISNGTTLSSKILLNISELKKIIADHENWILNAQIIQNIEEINESPTKCFTKIAGILILPEARGLVYHVYSDAINRIQNFNRYRKICSLVNLNLNKIPFYLADIEPVEINVNYEDIPSKYSENDVFNKFKCSLTSKSIRYPVIILNDDQTQPLKIPFEIFERKIILERLKDPLTSVYPNTTTRIDLCQVKEHVIIRGVIELEMKKLNLI